MINRSYYTNPYNGHARILHEIKAEYYPIRHSIRLKVSPDREQNISLVGNHIILNGHDPVEVGTLIKLKFDLRGNSKHKFGDYNKPDPDITFVGIGQVLNILESDAEKHKMLIRILDLSNMQ